MLNQQDATVARLMSLAAVGTEMASAILIGVFLDYWLGWMPVLSIIGAIAGLVGGVYHLIVLNRPKKTP